jgi:3-oxoacyl-[acyl-carrier-protein] synthase-3
MAFLEFKNVRIAGIAAGVPKDVDKPKSRNAAYSDEEFSKSVGVLETRFNPKFTTSDLCYGAAEQLISDLSWDKSEIDAIVFVSQTPDYILPATACILQDRLGLSKECYAADVSLGCSGWVYGLSLVAGLLGNGNFKKVLLMVGDARGRRAPISGAIRDHLFGFAGTVTAVEFKEGEKGFKFHLGTDGSGYDAIIIPDGGSRNPVNEESLQLRMCDDGIQRSRLTSVMNGMDVFSFAITTVPKSIKKLAENFQINFDDVDYLVLHQANKQINEKIAKKLKFEEERVPESLTYFGNTSSATIPLTIVAGVGKRLQNETKKFVTCGFGVGLSWGTVYFETENIVISDLVELE